MHITVRIRASMASIAAFFVNRNTVLILAIFLGFVLSTFAKYTQILVIPALAIPMLLSVSRNNLKEIFLPRVIVRPFITVLVLNFIILGGINLLLGHAFTQDPMLRAGFVILAASPPAIAITPFSYALGADVRFSLVATTTGFLASIILLPLVVGVFLGGKFNSVTLLVTLAEIIVLPIIGSQVLRLTGAVKYTEKYHPTIINWCFFIITFSVVGLNRGLILSSPRHVLAACIAFISIFVLGNFISLITSKLGVGRERTISYVLLSTMKNWAGASVIAFTLFGAEASIPGTVALLFGILYYIWLGIRYGTINN
jgi:predicted Na+-dependent transporter